MAKIINNMYLSTIGRKRDKAMAKLSFYESYLAIAEDIYKEKSDSSIRRKTLKTNSNISLLERKTYSPKLKAEKTKEAKLKKLEKKQRLPRLAIEQTYLRKSSKLGEDKATAYRKMELDKLDNKVNSVVSNYEAQAKNLSDDASKENLAEFEKQKSQLNAKLDDYKKTLDIKAKQRYEKLKIKTKKTICVLKERIEKYDAVLSKSTSSTSSKMENDNTVLEVNDLQMLFDGLKAVDMLSFKVKENEIFGLIGPNGAGKTTVFNCITQFNKPSNGSIYYKNANGAVINLIGKKVHDIVKTGIVRTFQNIELIWELSVLDNMLIGAHSLYNAKFYDHLLHTSKLRRQEEVMRAKAIDVLERLNLLEYKDVVPYGLPYGILKKIELARTLMVDPRLIILDEPAAGLNEAETEELSQTILKIRDDYNCTVFLVEHDMGLVMDICDTVCAISFGKKLAIGTPYEIQTNKTVQEAYLGGTMMEDEDE